MPAGRQGDDTASTTFGPYRLDALLGRGGMGEVHRAFDLRKQRVVALKRLPVSLGDEDGFRTRFRREAELAGRLSEPHVIPIHDFGEIDGQLYIDMRLVEGTDLASVLARRGRLPVERVVDIGRQVATALEAAHRAGLVHRDVKPSNILLTGPNQEFVYLIDFGIASSATSTRLTGTGVTIGTALYMAPERFTGREDHRVDVYGLCCVLYEALTGSPPFAGADFPALMWAHVNTPAPLVSSRRADVPPRLDAVIATGLAKDPSRRHQRAADLGDELGALEAPATLVDPTPPAGAAAGGSDASGGARRWMVATMVTLALLLVVAALAAVVVVTNRGPGSPDTMAARSVSALEGRDAAALQQVSCHRADGKQALQLPPNILALVQTVRPNGPVIRTLDSEARQTVTLTLVAQGQAPQSAPVDMVLVSDHHGWCLNNIEAGQ